MKKLEKYGSFDELKDHSATGTVSHAVLVERQKKIERLIHFLRGDEAATQPRPETKTNQIS